MSAKEYLRGLCMMDKLVNDHIADLDRLNLLATKVTPALKQDAGFGGGGNQDRLGDTVAKIVDLQEQINREVDAFANRRSEAYTILARVSEPAYKMVLHQRYFLGRTLEKTAEEMGYSLRGVCYLHGRALQSFERAMKAQEGKNDD